MDEETKPPDRKRRKRARLISVRVDAELYELCQRKAAAELREFSDWVRKTLAEKAAPRLSKSRLRGNPAAYVDGRPPRHTLTCSVHKGEPLFVTPEGAACRLCSAAGKAANA